MRLSVAIAAACLIVVGLSAADESQASIKKHTDIPAEDLGLALQTLAKDRGFQVVYVSDEVKSLKTQGASGDLTREEALTQLLKGTGLTYRYLNEDGVSIVPINAPASDTSGAGPSSPSVQPPASTDADGKSMEGKKGFLDRFRLAQVDQGTSPGPSPLDKENDQSSFKKKKAEQLEEVVVTGSRIPTPPGQQVLPVRAYTKEDIESSGQTTIAGFLNTLPDVSINASGTAFQGYLGSTTVQLHGLPTGTTLTLLNGRQVESNFLGFFDLSMIPTAAIERIEVVPVGSSAIYGSDALAGAVNMILRKDLNGLEVNAQYGRASATGEGALSAAWGMTSDRASISLIASYQNQTQLLTNDRFITSTTDVPAPALATDNSDVCFPGTIYSLNGQPLPGLGTATQAQIPTGGTGKPTLQSFRATAGLVNQCSSLLNVSLINPMGRAGALLSAHLEVNSRLDLFTETLFSEEHLTVAGGDLYSLFGGSFGLTTIGANNPYNPFGEEIGVSYAYPGIQALTKNWQTFVRPLVGARGAVAGDWTYEISTLMSTDREHDTGPLSNQSALQAALDSSDPATAFNPFTSGPPASPDVLQSMITEDVEHFKNSIYTTQALFRGTVASLPAGPLGAVLGGQFTTETLNVTRPAFGTSLDLGRHSYALFTEERVPILREHPLTASVAGRYDKYSDFAGKASGQVGLEWQPVKDVALRAGYASSYRAPELDQLAGLSEAFTVVVVDPSRGNATYFVPVVSGSNPQLRPELGNSRLVGIAYGDSGRSAFKASLNYFAIDITNYISLLPPQTLVDFPTLFPGAVTRAPPSPQDIALRYQGMITSLADVNYNYGDIRVNGVDLDLSYRWSTSVGTFAPVLSITDTMRYRAALSPALPEVGYLSQATSIGPGFAPRWKGTLGIAWSRQDLSAGLTGRYIGPYHDYPDVAPNTNVLGNSWITDLNLRYAAGKAAISGSPWYAHTYLQVGVVNLFDVLPKFSYGFSRYDYTEADIRGRFVYARIGVQL